MDATGGSRPPAARPAAPWSRLACAAAIALAIGLGALHVGALLASLSPAGAPGALAGVLIGALLADGLTGLVHWACDTWGDERTRWLGPSLIHAFREHHDHPRKMLEGDRVLVNREPGVAAAIALSIISLPTVAGALAERPFLYGLVCAFVAYGAAANQIHLWAHADRPPRAVRLAQRLGLVLTPERHARHHRGANDAAYCISTGWLNPALDRSGFWRGLERAVSALTGAAARAEPLRTARSRG